MRTGVAGAGVVAGGAPVAVRTAAPNSVSPELTVPRLIDTALSESVTWINACPPWAAEGVENRLMPQF
ncbi:MAG: hypothetical protein QM783_07555 [Phycisphaerales bacterium]